MKNSKRVKTPTIYQMEATECGAASLSMVFGYYGKFLPLEQMRIETGVSRDGCNAKNILRAARKFGLEAKGYKKSLESLLKCPGPCIIHWNFNHFVVWEGVEGKYAYINDPAMGRRKLTIEEVDDCYTGITLVFSVTDKFEKSKRKRTLFSFIKKRLKGQMAPIVALFAIGLCMVVPGMVVPIFSQFFIDEILLGTHDDWMSVFLAVMGFTILFKQGLTYWRGMLLEKFQNKMALMSAHEFLSHMFRLPMSFFDQRYSGDLSQRVENNNSVSEFLAGDLAETVLNIFVAAFYLIVLLIYSPVLTIIGIVNVVFNIVVVKLSSDSISNLTMKYQQDQGKLTGNLFAGLNITSTLKASGAENEYVSRIQGNYAKTILLEQDLGKRQEIINAIPSAANEITSVLVLLFGGLLVINGQLTAGMLVAYTSLLDSFTDPVNSLVSFVQKIQTLKSDMSRVEDIMNYEQDGKFKDTETVPMSLKLQGSAHLTILWRSINLSKRNSPLSTTIYYIVSPQYVVLSIFTCHRATFVVNHNDVSLYRSREHRHHAIRTTCIVCSYSASAIHDGILADGHTLDLLITTRCGIFVPHNHMDYTICSKSQSLKVVTSNNMALTHYADTCRQRCTLADEVVIQDLRIIAVTQSQRASTLKE